MKEQPHGRRALEGLSRKQLETGPALPQAHRLL